jgi:TolB-like protein
VKKAMALLEADPAGKNSVDELAAQCGVARRTLEKHFRRFVGRSPAQVKRELLLARVRRELLRASPEATTTDIAMRCGIGHLGRFAAAYRERYGESPSATLQGRRWALMRRQCASPILSPPVNRPIISVLPFNIVGVQAQASLTIGDEIAAALTRNRWLAVGRPGTARYRLRGTVRDDGARRVRVLVMLTDAATGQHLWADRWDGEVEDAFAFEERVAERVASAVERSVRAAEVQRACHMEPEQLGAWELTMKSLPRALLIEPTARLKRSNCSNGRWSSRRRMRFRSRLPPGAMASAPVTIWDRNRMRSGKPHASSQDGPNGSAAATRMSKRCWPPHTRSDETSSPQRSIATGLSHWTAGVSGPGIARVC